MGPLCPDGGHGTTGRAPARHGGAGGGGGASARSKREKEHSSQVRALNVVHIGRVVGAPGGGAGGGFSSPRGLMRVAASGGASPRPGTGPGARRAGVLVDPQSFLVSASYDCKPVAGSAEHLIATKALRYTATTWIPHCR